MIGANATHMTAINEPEIPCLAMRPREAAKALGICERTLWELTQKKLVPHIRLSEKIILYPVDVLRDWLTRRAQQESDIYSKK